MNERLPPLTALRAFDAAARHMSFAKAAQELNVTPAALSFQIKSLEDHLGTPLFIRLNRAVKLTEAGQALAPGAADGFAALTAAWRAARRLQDDGGLTVTAGPAFTAKWLAPRLYDFAQKHPEIDLRFSATLRLVDLARDEVDVAIRFGHEAGPGHYSLPLAAEWAVPVMTPDRAKQVRAPEDLLKAPLLFDDSMQFLTPRCDWQMWFHAHGIKANPTHGVRFSQADHAVDAALAGAGAVLGRRALVIKDLAEGRLVAPFPTAISNNAKFRFLCLEGAENRPAIVAFRDWIVTEIEKLSHVNAGIKVISVDDLPPL